MDAKVLLVAAVLIVIVNAIVFYLIIRTAVSSGSETQKRMKHAWAQTELLILLARRQGADDSAIKAITDHLR
jgi:hypothetical protein